MLQMAANCRNDPHIVAHTMWTLTAMKSCTRSHSSGGPGSIPLLDLCGGQLAVFFDHLLTCYLMLDVWFFKLFLIE